jgi:hypothetical protein
MDRKLPSCYIQFINQAIDISDCAFQAIKQKARAIQLYDHLIDQSPDDFITSFLNYARAYETEMKTGLDRFYTENFGLIPEYVIPPEETAFSSFVEGLELAFRYNSQSIVFERQIRNLLSEGDLGYKIFDYMLLTDMDQQSFLNTIYTHYLHYFS